MGDYDYTVVKDQEITVKIWRQGRDGRREIAQEAVKMCEDEAWVKRRLKAVNRCCDYHCYFHHLLLLVLISLLS